MTQQALSRGSWRRGPAPVTGTDRLTRGHGVADRPLKEGRPEMLRSMGCGRGVSARALAAQPDTRRPQVLLRQLVTIAPRCRRAQPVRRKAGECPLSRHGRHRSGATKRRHSAPPASRSPIPRQTKTKTKTTFGSRPCLAPPLKRVDMRALIPATAPGCRPPPMGPSNMIIAAPADPPSRGRWFDRQLARRYWPMARRMASETLMRSSAARSSRSRLSSGPSRTDSTDEAAEPIGGRPPRRRRSSSSAS